MHKIIRAQKNTAACMLLVPGGEERERDHLYLSHILYYFHMYICFIFVIDVVRVTTGPNFFIFQPFFKKIFINRPLIV